MAKFGSKREGVGPVDQDFDEEELVLAAVCASRKRSSAFVSFNRA